MDIDKVKFDTARILVIDDNPSIHEDFRKILNPFVDPQKERLSELDRKLFHSDLEQPSEKSMAPLHYNVDFANQGQEGIDIVKKSVQDKKPISLAFVDIRMPPGLDGVQTVEGIWKIDPWIQIVICTAYSDYSWDEMIAKLGVSDNLLILKKPFDLIEVRQLASALSEKWQLNATLKRQIGDLEATVKERTDSLEKSLALIRSTLESTADGILVEDLEGKIIDYNSIFSTMWPISDDILKSQLGKELLGFESKLLIDPEAFIAKIEFLNRNFESESVDELNFIDGRCFERYCKPHRMRDKIVGRVWSFRNITVQKKLHQELLFQATHDKLTNLPNRRLLNDRITQYIAFAKRNKTMIAVLLLDLDKFKLINDSLGHNAGDSVLKLVAKRISEVVRESDTLARLGGDEFVVVLNEKIELPNVEFVTKKIIDAIAKPFKLLSYDFSLTVSIGVSLYPKDGGSVEELLQKADGAMYSVKNEGKNGFKFYQENLAPHILQQLTLENDLRKAMQQNELKLYYQPLVEISSGNIVGAEALVRWQHPTLGLLMPEEFLQIAEESGLVIAIGEWILKTACMQNKAWQTEKLVPIKISINVSSTQFIYPAFDKLMEKILEETALSPQYLELELTETTIIENPELMLEVLNKIKKLGIELVVDDFGTGYSSLSYLRQFPFNKLKIDRSFVLTLCSNADDASLVQTIIAMGNNLKLKVVAEGVESIEQISLLRQYKCDQAQGFLFSKPIPVEEFSTLLRNHPNLSELYSK